MIPSHQHCYTRDELNRVLPAVYDADIAEAGPDCEEGDDGPRAKRNPSHQPDWPVQVMDVKEGFLRAPLTGDELSVLRCLYEHRGHAARGIGAAVQHMRLSPDEVRRIWYSALDKIIHELTWRNP